MLAPEMRTSMGLLLQFEFLGHPDHRLLVESVDLVDELVGEQAIRVTEFLGHLTGASVSRSLR